MHSVLPLLFTLAGFWPGSIVEPEAKRVIISTFANDPVVVGGALERTPNGLRARLIVRFANPSLAKTGVDALIFDRQEGQTGTTRVLTLRQRVNPDGDPDISMPVQLPILVDLPEPPGRLGTVVVLNMDPSSEDTDGPPRVHALDVSRAVDVAAGRQGDSLVASPFSAGRRLPSVAHVQLARQASGTSIRYTLAFEVEVTDASTRAEDVRFEIRGQSLGDEPPTVADWLFVSVPGQPGPEGPPRRIKVEFTTEVTAGPRRTLIIANVVNDPAATDLGRFRMVQIR